MFHPAVTAGVFSAPRPQFPFPLREEPTCFGMLPGLSPYPGFLRGSMADQMSPPSSLSSADMHGLVSETEYLFLPRAKEKGDSLYL